MRRHRQTGSAQRQPGSKRRRPRLCVERLEGRFLLATFAVDSYADGIDAAIDGNCDDGTGACTLRAAIMEANAHPGGDLILLPAGNYVLTRSGANEDAAATGDLDVRDTSGTTIVTGAGAAVTTIDASRLDRVFHVLTGASLELHGVLLTGGKVAGSGAPGQGGAIANRFGTLRVTSSIMAGNRADSGGAVANVVADTTLVDCVLSDNVADFQGGAIWHNSGTLTIAATTLSGNRATNLGGGMLIRTATVSNSFSRVAITDSTISGNRSTETSGGGIANFGDLAWGGTLTTIINSTVSGNATPASGGGIYNSGEARLELLHTTVTANSAQSSAGGIENNVFAVPPGGTVTLHNSLVAGNHSSQDPDARGPFLSQGHNLIGIAGSATGFTAPGDQVGTSLSPLNPQLGPLQPNGGPTATHALLPGSPAIDTGDNAGVGILTFDQRGSGFDRIVGGIVDVGAFEFGAGVPANHPPEIDGQSFEVEENTTFVGTVVATDDDLPADTLAYAISGGADAALFTIDGGTGELSFHVAPDYEIPSDADADNLYELVVAVQDGSGATASAGVQVRVLNRASVMGTVFVDVNQNAQQDALEPGIDGVVVQLLDGSGSNVLATVATDGAFYRFDDLAPGTYQVHEIQPSGVEDGPEILGSLGGTLAGPDSMQVTLERTDATNYDFAEIGQQVAAGDAATIGFWQSRRGQALIEMGGAGLTTWLSATFRNVFGNTFQDGAGGDDASEVATFYREELFMQKSSHSAGPPKADAQFMALALATFFTSSDLAGTVAVAFGFHVTDTGIGTKVVNVGANGAAFGVADSSDLTILQLLLAADGLTDVGDQVPGASRIHDRDGDGVIDAAERALRTMANSVFSWINENGDIS